MLKKIGDFFKPKDEQREATLALLAACVRQRAVCRVDYVEGIKEKEKKYLFPVELLDEGLALESRTPFFSMDWLGKAITFLMVVKGGPARPSKLYRFVSEINSVEGPFRACVSTPLELIPAERRQSVRIALQVRHMPSLAIWAVTDGDEGENTPKVDPAPLINLRHDAKDIPSVLLNLSSGGLRAAFSREQFELRGDALRAGSRVVVQLVFSSKAFSQAYPFIILGKIRNVLFGVDGKDRVGVGIQFMALRRPEGKPAWVPVNKTGIERIGRLINILQIEYYREAKRRLERLSSKN